MRRYRNFSLHASGKWRYGYTEKGALGRIPPEGDRAIDKWERRDFDEAGHLPAVGIEIRSEDLREVPGDKPPAEVEWIEPAAPGSYTSIRISIMKADTGYRVDMGGRWVGSIGLPNETAVMVVNATEIGHQEKWAALDAIRAQILAANPRLREMRGGRIAIFGSHDDTGIRLVYDMTTEV